MKKTRQSLINQIEVSYPTNLLLADWRRRLTSAHKYSINELPWVRGVLSEIINEIDTIIMYGDTPMIKLRQILEEIDRREAEKKHKPGTQNLIQKIRQERAESRQKVTPNEDDGGPETFYE